MGNKKDILKNMIKKLPVLEESIKFNLLNVAEKI